jgi:hypothetical protein
MIEGLLRVTKQSTGGAISPAEQVSTELWLPGAERHCQTWSCGLGRNVKSGGGAIPTVAAPCNATQVRKREEWVLARKPRFRTSSEEISNIPSL